MKKISATNARIRFGEVMNNAQYEPVVVERDGIPRVVVISIREYQQLKKAGKDRNWQQLVSEARQKVNLDMKGKKLQTITQTIQELREDRDEHISHLY